MIYWSTKRQQQQGTVLEPTSSLRLWPGHAAQSQHVHPHALLMHACGDVCPPTSLCRRGATGARCGCQRRRGGGGRGGGRSGGRGSAAAGAAESAARLQCHCRPKQLGPVRPGAAAPHAAHGQGAPAGRAGIPVMVCLSFEVGVLVVAKCCSLCNLPFPLCLLLQKLLGPTWRPAPPPPGARIISLDEYNRSKGWA